MKPCDCVINGLEFTLTSLGCPEQYDIFKDGKQVGYFRLRHGWLSVWSPGVFDNLLFECDYGDALCGQLKDKDRARYLKIVAHVINKKIFSINFCENRL